MCGISVIVGASADAAASVDRMVASLGHRGPDARGAHSVPGATLGHTRLSIIDLECGEQPMADMSGRYLITFNGEIYNYAELRDELSAEGALFRTHSDTEVVLAAYARWDAAALHRFRGMSSISTPSPRRTSCSAAAWSFARGRRAICATRRSPRCSSSRWGCPDTSGG